MRYGKPLAESNATDFKGSTRRHTAKDSSKGSAYVIWVSHIPRKAQTSAIRRAFVAPFAVQPTKHLAPVPDNTSRLIGIRC